MGARRGSSTGILLPSVSRSDMPRPLKIFSPPAPASTSASSCAAAASPQPGSPTPKKLMLAKKTNRDECPAMASSPSASETPLPPDRLTITAMLSSSISAARRSTSSADMRMAL